MLSSPSNASLRRAARSVEPRCGAFYPMPDSETLLVGNPTRKRPAGEPEEVTDPADLAELDKPDALGTAAAINGWSIKQQRQTLAPIFRSGPAGLGLKLRGKGRLFCARGTPMRPSAPPAGGSLLEVEMLRRLISGPAPARTCARTRGSRANSEGAAGAPRARLRTLRPRGWR